MSRGRAWRRYQAVRYQCRRAKMDKYLGGIPGIGWIASNQELGNVGYGGREKPKLNFYPPDNRLSIKYSCSCPMCSYPKWLGNSKHQKNMQQKKSDIKFKEALEELD